jgi:hypothetical protein
LRYAAKQPHLNESVVELLRAWKKSRGKPATSEAPKKSTQDFTVIG